MGMIIREHDVFSKWFGEQNDDVVVVITRRLARVSLGNFGNSKSVGGGVSELKIEYGKGFRIYYTIRGLEIVLLLCGGHKGSQKRDIKLAQELNKEVQK